MFFFYLSNKIEQCDIYDKTYFKAFHACHALQNISRVTIHEIYSLQSFEKLLCHEIKLALNFINASFQKLYLCKK